MHDLNITIVEESTKRVSKHLSYIYTSRHTITIEDEPETAIATKTTTPIRPATKQLTTTTKATTSRALTFADTNGEELISRTVTTTELPPFKGPLQSRVKIWSTPGNDKDLNYLIHIKTFKDKKPVKQPRLEERHTT